MVEEKDSGLIELLLEKNILKTWPSNPQDYYCLPIPNRPDLEIDSITIKKEDLGKLVRGVVKEIIIDIYQEIERKSLHNDGIEDVKFYNGIAEITFDKEKLVFDLDIYGNSYWDTR